GETLDADLRPRQIGQNAHFGTHALRGGAHRSGALGLAGGIAVGEVQADHVDAGTEQFVKHARRVGGRAEGGEDLGAALAFDHWYGSLNWRKRYHTMRRLQWPRWRGKKPYV